MRDFRDAKAMARTLRKALAAKDLKISNSDSLELIAQAFGLRDWNTLSAMLSAELADPPRPAMPPPSPAPQQAYRHGGFSDELEKALHRSVALADQSKHEYAGPEHLLLALADDHDAVAVLTACAIDIDGLKAGLADYLDTGPGSIVVDHHKSAVPTAAFHRIIQRAVIHVQSSGSTYVTGANVLVAIFSERESHAARFLLEHKLTRHDAVNFIAHGIAKGGGTATA
jgi:hypothetical protein